jgi:lipoprotein-anchoring transpeptidase ErfK/SrfK
MKLPKMKSNPWLSDLASRDIRVEHGRIDVFDESPIEKKRHWLRNRVTLSAVLVISIIIIGWIVASIYLPNIRLGDNLVSVRQSDTALQNLIQKQASGYKLTIVYPDNSKKIYSLQDTGLSVDYAATVASVRHEQHQLASRLQWWHPTRAYMTVRSNNTQLYSFVAGHTSVTIQPAKDATLSIENGSVKLTDSTFGKQYGLHEPVVTLYAAISNLRSTPLHLQILSTHPPITSKQLAPYQTALKKILNQRVAFRIGDTSTQASPADIADWIELTPLGSGKPIDITVNSGKVLAYISKISANAVHPPKAQVEVVNPDGTSTVLVKGVNGTDVVNNSAAAGDVAQSLLAGKAVQETLAVQYAAYKSITAGAYAKWIEVDTTNKRMYAYEQSTLVRTFLVSAGAPRTPTVTGQFAIYSKYVQQDMRGQNVDGSSYSQPNVPWVSYFYADYAIHGNYWRPTSYFGNINSSHGCVGVVDSDAQWVYSWAPIGTPVIVHT